MSRRFAGRVQVRRIPQSTSAGARALHRASAFALNEISDKIAAATSGAILTVRILEGRLYQFDLIPILEDIGEPVPLRADCPEARLRAAYREIMDTILENSRL